MATKTLTGACLCGKITYAIDLPATEPNPKVVLCHCTSCKRYSGGGFSTNIMIPRESFRYTSGTPKVFLDPSTDSGNLLPREICGDCGCHFTSAMPDWPVVALKWGTLDEEHRAGTELLGEIYCKRKDAWLESLGRGDFLRAEGMSS
ncbi:Mss4-like protein [Aspergillus pseudodeflectus]|uniref:Mss4-like protein n=1 Tax=Aspergillus pseudodeflectus TaxID=176178 RepID=A0ABR4L5X4_9EURO